VVFLDNFRLSYLNTNLKVICFTLFLRSDFLIFKVTIIIRYCTLSYIVCLFCVFGVFSAVCAELSVPVQVIAYKDSSLK